MEPYPVQPLPVELEDLAERLLQPLERPVEPYPVQPLERPVELDDVAAD